MKYVDRWLTILALEDRCSVIQRNFVLNELWKGSWRKKIEINLFHYQFWEHMNISTSVSDVGWCRERQNGTKRVIEISTRIFKLLVRHSTSIARVNGKCAGTIEHWNIYNTTRKQEQKLCSVWNSIVHWNGSQCSQNPLPYVSRGGGRFRKLSHEVTYI